MLIPANVAGPVVQSLITGLHEYHRARRLSRSPRCYIYIAPSSYLQRNRVSAEAVRRHEIAHCNGWPAGHPRLLEWDGKGEFDPNPVYRSAPKP